jgi:hypothetical protein
MVGADSGSLTGNFRQLQSVASRGDSMGIQAALCSAQRTTQTSARSGDDLRGGTVPASPRYAAQSHH